MSGRARKAGEKECGLNKTGSGIALARVFVVGMGRCGSKLLSEMLRLRILSASGLFAYPVTRAADGRQGRVALAQHARAGTARFPLERLHRRVPLSAWPG